MPALSNNASVVPNRVSRIAHTMLRVTNLDRSLAFYIGKLGMTLFRREDYPDGRFTLALVGYEDEQRSATIELTYNWGRDRYDQGSAYGHVALEVDDVVEHCAQLRVQGVPIVRGPGPMTAVSPQRQSSEVIAFIEDPDGYRIELIQRRR
jgi:lactoylglutathione lyase